MKKNLFVLILAVSVIAFFGFTPADAKEPKLSGVAYIQGHGGHIAVLDLATGDVARYDHGKECDALELSPDGSKIYSFSLDGFSKEIDIASGKQTDWAKFGKKHCGTATDPKTGNIWVSDMADGHVYIYDPKTKKLVDKFPVSKSICGINIKGDRAFITDMPGGFINIVDVKKKKVIGKIEGVGTFLHRGRIKPGSNELWQSDGAELSGGKPAGVGYAGAEAISGMVRIVDIDKRTLKDTVVIGGNVHDVEFTPDGKYALVASRQLPEREDSAVVVVDTNTKRVLKVYSACKKCHGAMGIELSEEKDAGRPFLCAIQVNWKQKGIPASAETIKKLSE